MVAETVLEGTGCRVHHRRLEGSNKQKICCRHLGGLLRAGGGGGRVFASLQRKNVVGETMLVIPSVQSRGLCMQRHIHEYNMVTYLCTVTVAFGSDKQYLVSGFSGCLERKVFRQKEKGNVLCLWPIMCSLSHQPAISPNKGCPGMGAHTQGPGIA